MSDIEKALKVAERIKDALLKKFPKYEGFVRRFETQDSSSYIEIMIKPEGTGRAQELTVAYADEFFMSANEENLKAKAGKIYGQFKALVGTQ